MTTSLLLDTHMALWLVAGHPRLAGTARRAIEAAWEDGGTLFLSPVSVWEVVTLDRKRRIQLNGTVGAWVDTLLRLPCAEALPLGVQVPIKAYGLPGLEHSDPADRLLIASAIDLGCPLLTYDAKIIRFARDHGAAHGFTVLS